MTGFARMLRDGEAQRRAKVAHEAQEAQAIVSEALAPHYARGWDRAMRRACPELFDDPRASASTAAGRRPRRGPTLGERMASGRRRQPERDETGDGWDVAMAPYAATAAEIEAHRHAHEPSPADLDVREPSWLIAARPEGRGTVRSGADSALSRFWRRMFSPA